MSAETTGEKQRGRPFQPGQSGNPLGRPKGAKHKLTDTFISTIAKDFAEHGAEAIARVRVDDPVTYLKVVGAMVPRELLIQHELEPNVDYAELTFEEAAELADAERKRQLIRKAIEGW